MSQHIEPMPVEDGQEGGSDEQFEPLYHCTECEYVAPKSEFIPEDYR